MSRISHCLWFDGKAEEAARFYVSLLPDSRIDSVIPYSVDGPGGAAGKVMLVEFTLAGLSYQALNGGPHYQFTPAISLSVTCEDQAEVDRLWAALCDGGTPVQCGWVTDRYGLSWQVVPRAFIDMMKSPDKAAVRRATAAMMTMIKLDVAALERAFAGE
ncbi:VOC family protein [Iodidimonas sp. SYSU 1G8]|uniref:VOC family protein n=1 Tax=Iodidimonas sp. SYSU 1G8 TaxID=3133967 RepID=UPI0031FF3DD2